MTVTENGRTRRVPRLEAILLRAASEASRGDGRALRLLLQLTERYGESAQTGAEHETIVAEDIAILRRYLPHFDDPLKPDDALSEAKRSAANQWFANTLLSRLDDKRTGAIVIVMQRVHMDDLTGFLLSQSHEWELLSLPAIAEFKETIPLGNGRLAIVGNLVFSLPNASRSMFWRP